MLRKTKKPNAKQMKKKPINLRKIKRKLRTQLNRTCVWVIRLKLGERSLSLATRRI